MNALRWSVLFVAIGIVWLVIGTMSLGGDDSINTGAFVTGAAFFVGGIFSWRSAQR